ncbi:MAG: DUF2959 domain-containing protein [Desulfocapsaceae bacterium]|jgi:hypothetical protein|nr:DUF2959 domain-containing protein [Desulfocapsaceae bacterium]
MKYNLHTVALLCAAVAVLFLSGCSSTYYGAMEKVGIHKRDIMVDRVADARDSQAEAQEQFQSALDQFSSVVTLKETDLKKAYEHLNKEYEACSDAAADVSARIEKVESVSSDLFREWQSELDLYENKELAAASKRQLTATRTRYDEMIEHMYRAEKSMDPVLTIFRDNVLFLKHNLNAQAIGSLQDEFSNLEMEIDTLIARMSAAIESSNAFIAEMEK